MEVNGIAHIFLTASNFERSREFYRELLPFLGLKPVIDTETTYYCVGGRTAVGISAPSAEHDGAAFEQKRVGLHHLCFRARERADVDELHGFLMIARRQDHPRAARGSVGAGILLDLFEDPDGIRLELNHVPGKGLSGVTPSGWVERRDTHRSGSFRLAEILTCHATRMTAASAAACCHPPLAA